jgi:Trypsin
VFLETTTDLAPPHHHLRREKDLLFPDEADLPLLKNDRLLTEKPPPQSIVGGTFATSRPWFVQGNGCGGVLIWNDIVLTAAHCEIAFLVGSTVYIGNTKRNTAGSGVETKRVKNFIPHHPFVQ